ncbi:hypothetical protein BH23BAC2_BH23BAC2_09230 [soil metagenome]
MKIEHLAIWTHDLEKVKDFYVKYLNMKFGENVQSWEGKGTVFSITLPIKIKEISKTLNNEKRFFTQEYY